MILILILVLILPHNTIILYPSGMSSLNRMGTSITYAEFGLVVKLWDYYDLLGSNSNLLIGVHILLLYITEIQTWNSGENINLEEILNRTKCIAYIMSKQN